MKEISQEIQSIINCCPPDKFSERIREVLGHPVLQTNTCMVFERGGRKYKIYWEDGERKFIVI